MNNYPVWWDTTITVYNKYEDPQTQLVTWYRHLVKNCFFKDVSDSILVGKTNLETKNIVCRIPKQTNFVERYQWVSKDSTQKGTYLTIGVEDIIVKGEVSDVINEYQSGQRASDVIAKYKKLQGCLQVEEFAINVGAGRCNEHYYVRGV